MSPKGRNHLVFLEDILEAIAKIERYTQGLSLETFRENDMAVDAVIRNFEVIGEAVRHIPDDVKERYPDVEWKEAAGFRNILIHDYFGIDVEAVWDTMKNNIPTFKKHVIQHLTSEQKVAPERFD